jgi:hypothetical protein
LAESACDPPTDGKGRCAGYHQGNSQSDEGRIHIRFLDVDEVGGLPGLPKLNQVLMKQPRTHRHCHDSGRNDADPQHRGVTQE